MPTGSRKQSWSAVAVTLVLFLLVQQVSPVPVDTEMKPHQTNDQILRRVARMTPLWRIMNSKPYGAYCQNNYECSTGICRAGYCSSNQVKTQ
ncbi:liver-expressed antimicrobial peptide 2 [Neosynchiropus ocellatus]